MRTTDRVEMVSRKQARRQGFALDDGETAGGDVPRPMLNTPYGAIGALFVSPLDIPCTAPPWGFIGAVDRMTGKLSLFQAARTARDTGPLGLRSMLPITIGTPLIGGSIVIRGGLIFVGAAAESTIRPSTNAPGANSGKAGSPAAATRPR